MQQNHGFILESPVKSDFVFGASNELGGTPLVPDANWFGWLPDEEVQNLNGIEPYACVSFTILNCVEILERQEYGATNNWSDRWLATITGTKALKGNSPRTVAEALRKKGCVPEKDLPFDITIDTYDKFYAQIKQSLYTLALAFPAEYDFGYEFIPPNATALMDALKYSPVAFSVYAWVKDENGLYYRPQGMTDNHLTTCYGYLEGKYWRVFDSYKDGGVVYKEVRWDSLPMQAMRFTLHRQIVSQYWFDRFLYWLRQTLGL